MGERPMRIISSPLVHVHGRHLQSFTSKSQTSKLNTTLRGEDWQASCHPCPPSNARAQLSDTIKRVVYVGICSVIGSLTVMSIKAVGIAIKLTTEGINHAGYFQTWIFAVVSVTCIVIQLVYLNKALDTFNTAVVSPIYYAMFTTLTSLASAIMFKVRFFFFKNYLVSIQDWSRQRASNIASDMCGFLTVLAGTVVLHSPREPDQTVSADLYTPLPPKIYWHIQGNGGVGKQKEDESLTCEFITVAQQDYFV